MLEFARQYGRSPGYQEIWKKIITARIPANRTGYRWRIRSADLPLIAAAAHCG